MKSAFEYLDINWFVLHTQVTLDHRTSPLTIALSAHVPLTNTRQRPRNTSQRMHCLNSRWAVSGVAIPAPNSQAPQRSPAGSHPSLHGSRSPPSEAVQLTQSHKYPPSLPRVFSTISMEWILIFFTVAFKLQRKKQSHFSNAGGLRRNKRRHFLSISTPANDGTTRKKDAQKQMAGCRGGYHGGGLSRPRCWGSARPPFGTRNPAGASHTYPRTSRSRGAGHAKGCTVSS